MSPSAKPSGEDLDAFLVREVERLAARATRTLGRFALHNRYQRHLANGTISNPTDLIVAWLRWYVPAPIRSRPHCEGSPEAVGTRFLTARCLVMAANHLNRVLIDNSEFLEAVELMLLRRESASPAARRDIDRAIERLNEGDVVADQLRVYWHETTQEGDTVVHITAGPALLELALPSNDDTD